MKKILIFGYGSIGRKHRKVLSNLISKCEIIFFTNQKNCNYKSINNFRDAKLFNPDYIILSKPTNDHEKFAKLIEKNFRKKKVLIEKPAYFKNNRLKLKKNLYFVGYNLRFSPVLKKIKNFILNKKIIDINVVCSSYLPNWRKNIEYSESSSAKKKYYGGVLFDLSHELDYLNWIFGDLKINHFQYKKISNLRIETKDSLIIIGLIKNKQVIINLNFFSRIQKREIIINTEDFSIIGNILKNELEFCYEKKTKKIKFKKIKDETYIKMHKEILNQKKKRSVCKLEESLQTLKIIKKIDKFNNV